MPRSIGIFCRLRKLRRWRACSDEIECRHSGYGGTGRRARLRIWYRKVWGFKSLYPQLVLSRNRTFGRGRLARRTRVLRPLQATLPLSPSCDGVPLVDGDTVRAIHSPGDLAGRRHHGFRTAAPRLHTPIERAQRILRVMTGLARQPQCPRGPVRPFANATAENPARGK